MSYRKEYCTENHGANHVLLSDEALSIFLCFCLFVIKLYTSYVTHLNKRDIC